MENNNQQQNPQVGTINVANKIRNTSFSKYQGLMPLFELISNSIHSIDERKKAIMTGDRFCQNSAMRCRRLELLLNQFCILVSERRMEVKYAIREINPDVQR